MEWLFIGLFAYSMYKAVSLLCEMTDLTEQLRLTSTQVMLVKMSLVVLIVAFVAGLALYAKAKSNRYIVKTITNKTWDDREGKSKQTESTKREVESSSTPSSSESASSEAHKNSFFVKYADVLRGDWVSIKAPSDFNGKYLGSTVEKTRQLLESCLGKVLFVDEAYGLMPGKYHADVRLRGSERNHEFCGLSQGRDRAGACRIRGQAERRRPGRAAWA